MRIDLQAYAGPGGWNYMDFLMTGLSALQPYLHTWCLWLCLALKVEKAAPATQLPAFVAQVCTKAHYPGSILARLIRRESDGYVSPATEFS
jgi:hypothetical protein